MNLITRLICVPLIIIGFLLAWSVVFYGDRAEEKKRKKKVTSSELNSSDSVLL